MEKSSSLFVVISGEYDSQKVPENGDKRPFEEALSKFETQAELYAKYDKLIFDTCNIRNRIASLIIYN